MASVINDRRLRDYPRLVLVSTWGVLAANLLLHQGWLGGLARQIIGTDFVTLYASGWLWRADAGRLYDLAAQAAAQQSLIQPTPLTGVNPFISPPYVAWAYSALTALPLAPAFLLWTLLTLLCVLLCAEVAARWLTPAWLEVRGLSRAQMVVLIASSFAFVEGLQVGQNHGLTLLLVTGIVACSLSGRWLPAGLLAGLLLYKPQFVLGFLIVWLVWRCYRALAAFAMVAAVWVGGTLLAYGVEPYWAYLAAGDQILRLPSTPGFPAFLLVTPYGFLATLLPDSAYPFLRVLAPAGMAAAALALAWLAFRVHQSPSAERRPLLALAVLFPLLATPYALLHDMVIALPVLLLLAANGRGSKAMLGLAIGLYVGALALPALSYVLGVALGALLPVALLVACLHSRTGAPADAAA